MLLELIRTRFERKIIAPGTLGGPKIAEGSNVGLFLKAPAFFAAQRSLAPDLPGPGSDSDPLDGTLDHYPLRAGGRVPRSTQGLLEREAQAFAAAGDPDRACWRRRRNNRSLSFLRVDGGNRLGPGQTAE